MSKEINIKLDQGAYTHMMEAIASIDDVFKNLSLSHSLDKQSSYEVGQRVADIKWLANLPKLMSVSRNEKPGDVIKKVTALAVEMAKGLGADLDATIASEVIDSTMASTNQLKQMITAYVTHHGLFDKSKKQIKYDGFLARIAKSGTGKLKTEDLSAWRPKRDIGTLANALVVKDKKSAKTSK